MKFGKFYVDFFNSRFIKLLTYKLLKAVNIKNGKRLKKLRKIKIIFSCMFLAALIIMLPICFADEIKATEGVVLKNSNGSTQTPNNSTGSSAQAASVATEFPGLIPWLAALIAPFIEYIAIGTAIIFLGYIVYRVDYAVWTWYYAYAYSGVDSHAYDAHKADFPNIWSNTIPPRPEFDEKCEDNMNSKSSSIKRYVQVSDGKSVAYNPSTGMISIGRTDGNIIDTCFRDGDGKYTQGKLNKGLWKLLK